MADTVLIISDETDAHADSVVLELNARGASVFRLHTADYPSELQLSVEVRDGQLRGWIESPHRSLEIGEVCAAWYRRPGEPRASAELDPTAVEYTRTQARRALWMLYSCLDVHWVGNPFKLRLAEIKALQLRIAREVGLATPPTLISNHPDMIDRFVRGLRGDCAVKPLDVVGVAAPDGYRFPLTTKLPKSRELTGARLAPTMYQQYMEKKSELRVVVVGHEMFCAEIVPSVEDEGRFDWRATESRYLVGPTLPDGVRHSLLALLERFGLNFASIDMILTPDDQFVFLELNPNGQWLWLEHMLGFPLSARMADLLTLFCTPAGGARVS